MLFFLTFALTAAAQGVPTEVPCAIQTVQGMAFVGFEASYIRVDRGGRAGQSIWIEDANRLSQVVGRPAGQRVIRRARAQVSGCIISGQFGHMNAYRLKFRPGSTITRL